MSLPQHIAIIMDGNGRWALQRSLPRMVGHQAGRKALKEIVKVCVEKSIAVLTVYAFSAENWKRPQSEVDGLMRLFRVVLDAEAKKLHKNNIRFKVIGDVLGLSSLLQEKIFQAEFLTQNNTGLRFNVAINYGARQEIVRATRLLAQKVQTGELNPTEIDEALFTQHLWLKDKPEPDLLIRTSGEHRISNFLLWQSAYTEFYFSDVYFPDFDRQAFEKALSAFGKRQRRYGKTVTSAIEEEFCA